MLCVQLEENDGRRMTMDEVDGDGFRDTAAWPSAKNRYIVKWDDVALRTYRQLVSVRKETYRLTV